MKLAEMTDQQLIQLAISTHNAIQTHQKRAAIPHRHWILLELKRRGYEPRTTLTFVRTCITRGGEKT